MRKEITNFLGAPWAFLIGAAAGLYYSDHYMKSKPSGSKKAMIVIGTGVALHLGWRALAKGDQRVYVEPLNGPAPIKGVKQTK